MFRSSSNRLLLLLSLTAFLTVKANPRRHSTSLVNDQRVVGGQEVKDETVPFMVAVVYSGLQWCGGSILNERTVLSAAHCFHNKDFNKFVAYVGNNTVKKGRLLGITAVHSHSDFVYETFDNDVALLRLNETLQYNAHIQPIGLVTSNTMLKTGSKVTVYGWGRIEYGGTIPEILKVAEFPIVDHALCKRLMSDDCVVTENMFCAGEMAGKVDSCSGDSGGPLLQNGVVIGIVSWGFECARPYRPGVYTDVRRMLPWIKETLKEEYGEGL